MFDALKAILAFWIAYQGSYFLRMQYNVEPIVICPLVGLFLGDLRTGIILGGALEAIFLGVMVVGGERPSNPAIAATVCTYYTISGGLDLEAAIAVAYPVAIVGNQFGQIVRAFTYAVLPWMMKLAPENPKAYERISLVFMNFVSMLSLYIAAFVCMALGNIAIDAIQNRIPGWLITGFQKTGAALAGLGMAITLNMLWDVEIIGFFFIGFVMFKAMGLSLIQIAVIATSVAAVYLFIDIKLNKSSHAQPVQANAEGDDFDL